MPMIPDAGLPAQPTELYRADITNSATDSVIFDAPDEALTREDIVAAIVAGDRTEQEIRDRFGVRLDRLLKGGEHSLFHLLHGLVMDDLLYMEWPFGKGRHYKATKKGRELAKARQGGAS